MFVLLELGPSSQHFMPLLHALLPWAMHHRHAVRVPVQVRPVVQLWYRHAVLDMSICRRGPLLHVQVRQSPFFHSIHLEYWQILLALCVMLLAQ
jgi:hypothetical protein